MPILPAQGWDLYSKTDEIQMGKKEKSGIADSVGKFKSGEEHSKLGIFWHLVGHSLHQ
jgi:hypothetical protein